jgi:two-component system chemotaxis response regulator CheY
MKTLTVEDDFTNRLFLQEIRRGFGPAHIAVNGKEAIEAVRLSFESSEPYQLTCLDIMMPEMDGQSVLKGIRALEEARGI